MRPATALAAVALAVAAAGCGSQSAPPTNRAAAPGLFAHACGGCHTLAGHESASHQGGDLLDVHLRRAVLVQFTREMPVSRPLTRAELQAIVNYLLAVQRGRR